MRLIVLAGFVAAAACGPPTNEGEGEEGEGEGPQPCVIGDETAEATDLQLVYRDVDGALKPVAENGEIPLQLPPQFGKVIYIGIQGKNLTCRVQVTAALRDTCETNNPVITLRGQTCLLEDDGSGTAIPVNDATDVVVPNLSNIAVCANLRTQRDMNNQPWILDVLVTEGFRLDEEEPRTHSLSTTIVPVCGEPEQAEFCNCECDADFNQEQTAEEQCPTIHDNDDAFGVCPG